MDEEVKRASGCGFRLGSVATSLLPSDRSETLVIPTEGRNLLFARAGTKQVSPRESLCLEMTKHNEAYRQSNSRLKRPAGTPDNSPAFQRRVDIETENKSCQ